MNGLMIKRRVVAFRGGRGSSPPRDPSTPLEFAIPVTFGPDQIGTAAVAIGGFEFRYGASESSPEQHHLLRLLARFDTPDIGYSETDDVWGVIVRGEVGIKDHGEFDDPYWGRITLLVFAY